MAWSNIMADREYLDSLIKHCQEQRKQFVFTTLQTDNLTTSYLLTKKTSFIGYKHGYYETINRRLNGIEEAVKIRSNCRRYLKLLKTEKGNVMQIENYKNGEIDCIHQALEMGSAIYLFPFSAEGGFYPTYTYVTKYDGDRVNEEYMVNGNQIIYEKYERVENAEAYYFINYVRNGRVPVLEERKGIFYFDPFRFVEGEYKNWRIIR